MKAAFLLGRGLTRRQKAQLGFVRGTTPCHATLTETGAGASPPNLAMSLNNLATFLSDLGRREEALAAAQEAEGLPAEK